MKQLFLPVLIWTLAISQILAQKTLPLGAVAPVNTLALSAQKILQQAGFNTNRPGNPQGIQSRSTPLQLDSTKRFTNYPLNGQDSTPIVRTIYQYPQTHVSVATEAQLINDIWRPMDRATTTTDALDRIIHISAEDYDNQAGNWVKGSQLKLFPHGNSLTLIDSILVSEWQEDVTAWVQVFSLQYIFDAQNRLQKTLASFDFDGQPGFTVDTYFYDANNDNHLIESSIMVSGFSLPTGKQDLSYVNHLLIQTIEFTSNGLGGFMPVTRTTYAYNAQNQVKQENTYNWVEGINDWSPDQIIISGYDNNMRLITTETETFEQGQSIGKQKVMYGYMQDEYLSVESNYTWDNALNQYTLNYREYYYYSGGSSAVLPAPRNTAPLQIAPNPTTGLVRVSIAAEAHVQVFDLSGHLLSSQIVQPGDNLNLTTLPAGIYQVTAQNDAAFYTGKVVKQ